MTTLVTVLFIAVLLLGIVQWARSGVVLVDLVKLTKKRTAGNDAETREAKVRERETLRELESITDRLLRSSFQTLGVLALCVWLFVVASVVLDILGSDWAVRLSFHANQLWGNPSSRAGVYGAPRPGTTRNDILRSVGSGLRR